LSVSNTLSATHTINSYVHQTLPIVMRCHRARSS